MVGTSSLKLRLGFNLGSAVYVVKANNITFQMDADLSCWTEKHAVVWVPSTHLLESDNRLPLTTGFDLERVRMCR